MSFLDPPFQARMDPDDRLNWSIDWTGDLNGEAITSSTWILTGIDRVVDTFDADSTTITVQNATHKSTAVNRIAFGGLSKDRTITFFVEEH